MSLFVLYAQQTSLYFHTAVNSAKKAYLLLYNGVQWAGFILIVMTLLKSLTKGMGGHYLAHETNTHYQSKQV